MALAQTNAIIQALARLKPSVKAIPYEINTSGDRDNVSRLAQHGGKGGAFVHELRSAMKAGKVDLLMHSLKDLPGNEEYYETEKEFRIGAFLERDDPRDVVVIASGKTISDVFPLGVVGTNSVRRKGFLKHAYRNLSVVHYRGAADTRLEKLDQHIAQKLPYGSSAGPVDGLVMAASGLKRIGLGHRISQALEIDEMCPAVGQGVVVVEYLASNTKAGDILSGINHIPTMTCCLAERAMVRVLNGDCNSPIAGHSWISGGALHLRGVVLSSDGKCIVEHQMSSEILSPEQLGERLALALIERGADKIIEMESRAYD